MAAKTFQEWLDRHPSLMDGEVLVDLQDCWDAATKAAEENSLNTINSDC